MCRQYRQAASIHSASQGIPRRINSLCDRLLLLGFMAGRTHLSVADVEEVLQDVAKENELPAVAPVQGGAQRALAALPDEGVSIDVTQFEHEPGALDGIATDFGQLGQHQVMDRLQSLESSLMRLERINLQTLGLLQKFVEAVRGGSGEGKP